MEHASGLILKNICSLANLNLRTKFEFTKQKVLHIKLLGNGIQQKLYFNNIVSVKSMFLANYVIWKT